MPFENPIYQRFPTQIVPDSAHSARWGGQRYSANGSDARVQLQSRPYWFSDLSGCLCTDPIREYLHGLFWRNGAGFPILNAVPPFCEIGQVQGRSSSGQPRIIPQVLGNTAQGRTFQLVKRLLVPGYENEQIFYKVTKPNYDYPALEGLGMTTGGVVKVTLLPELELFVNNTLLPRNLWTCNRDTGQPTVNASVNGTIAATGGFYILMLLPQEIPMKSKGNGVWEISSGIRLEEPFGGA